MNKKLQAFERVLQIMDELRTQCPWDSKQTNETLRTLTIEEVYELSDAVIKNSFADIRQELGDILLHIVFYSKIGEENGQFDIADVCNGLAEKLIQRHPHIYGRVVVKNEQDVKDNWEKIKLENGSGSALGGVPESLPSLIKALRIQDKARGVGFDWEKSEQVWDKVKEEMEEFEVELNREKKDHGKLMDEFGDILFALVNYARFIDINPDDALERTNKRFISRFTKMEELIRNDGKQFREMTLIEMEEYWQKAKTILGN